MLRSVKWWFTGYEGMRADYRRLEGDLMEAQLKVGKYEDQLDEYEDELATMINDAEHNRALVESLRRELSGVRHMLEVSVKTCAKMDEDVGALRRFRRGETLGAQHLGRRDEP